MDNKKNAKKKKFYTLKSDLMFHIALQGCNPALKSLVAAVLDIEKEAVTSVEVLNPIKEGEHVAGKKIIMDLLLKLDNSAYINMEMQVERYEYMPQRTLFYWARSYASIEAGEDYCELRPVYQVSIIDYVLFKDDPNLTEKDVADQLA